jgi:hypothetical protein
MSIVVITKSLPVVVVSSTAPADTMTTVQQIKLSPFDTALAFSPSTAFQIFTQAIHQPAETVRKGLSRALVHYFPVAGRAVVADDGDLRISCTGEGVAFVAASANCSFEEVKLCDPPFATLLRDLAIDYPEESCRPSDPLLLMQVTEFSCGGYVVGTTWNHAISDGQGIAQFLHAVGELARGLPLPSVLPVSCGDETLPELPPLVKALEKAMTTLPPRGFVYQDITVPWTVINRVKAEFVGGDEPCTVFEALVAVLWQCRTRAVMSDSGMPAPLVFAANVRKLVGAKDGYYGNCVTSAVIVPTSGDVANGGVKDVVKLIKRAKNRIPEQFNKVLAAAAGGGEESADVEVQQLLGYNAFYVSTWHGLCFDAADFGGGSPARVMCHVELTAVPNCVACLPCKGKDGANVLALCVREEHVDAFLQELAKLT